MCLHWSLSAQALGLPLVPPSIPEEETSPFPTGANFAVFAATALSPDYYRTNYNFTMPSPSHLDLQLQSFKKVLARIAPGDATKSLLGESLVVMGEIGGNDYNFWFFALDSRDTPSQYMPAVVGRIGAAVQEVVNLGARTVLVPGNFPIGCVPQYLSMFQSSSSNASSDYDQYGCLVWFNDFSQKHNQLLRQEVGRLRSQNPGVQIIFADYFGAAMQFVQNPKNYGKCVCSWHAWIICMI
jgi:phospholipase/lecithinase/hemolysin